MNRKLWDIIVKEEEVVCPPYDCLTVPIDEYEYKEDSLNPEWRFVNRQLADKGIENFYYPKPDVFPREGLKEIIKVPQAPA